MQYQRRKYTETPGGGKASARPRSAVARGGSPAAPESVVYFRSGKRHQPPLILVRSLSILCPMPILRKRIFYIPPVTLLLVFSSFHLLIQLLYQYPDS